MLCVCCCFTCTPEGIWRWPQPVCLCCSVEAFIFWTTSNSLKLLFVVVAVRLLVGRLLRLFWKTATCHVKQSDTCVGQTCCTNFSRVDLIWVRLSCTCNHWHDCKDMKIKHMYDLYFFSSSSFLSLDCVDWVKASKYHSAQWRQDWQCGRTDGLRLRRRVCLLAGDFCAGVFSLCTASLCCSVLQSHDVC